MAGLKAVAYRGGVVRFRIPATWVVEQGEDGGGTFYEDRPDSGTLRLNILTFEGRARPQGPDLLRALARKPAEPELLPTGNAVVCYREATSDDGQDVVVFHWQVANGVVPSHLRLALFSYTVARGRESDPEVRQEVALLDREIRAAEFSEQLGAGLRERAYAGVDGAGEQEHQPAEARKEDGQ